MLLESLFAGDQSGGGKRYARFLEGGAPVFTQFGQSIYASDVVQTCIDIIATEISKLRPRHIRRGPDGLVTSLRGDALNRLWRFGPNELMTTREFLEKIVWLLYLNYNAFIYPTFTVATSAGGLEYRTYTAFWPLNPIQVDFLQDPTSRLFVKFRFRSGDSYTLPYSDIIHLRKRYSLSDVMGGGLNGQPDQAPLLKVLDVNDTVLQGVAKAVRTSLQVRGILKINTLTDDDKQRAEREKFERAMVDSSSASAILPTDLKAEYTPLTVDPKLLDEATLRFLEDKVLNWFGVSLPIFSGKYTDDEYQAFYNKTLEPLVIGLGQAFSRTLFTQREQDLGHEIVFYTAALELLSVRSKLAIMDGLGARGALTNNELLALFGLEPYEDGNRRFVSLNYIDAAIANEYQMLRASRGTITDLDGNGGGADGSHRLPENADQR